MLQYYSSLYLSLQQVDHKMKHFQTMLSTLHNKDVITATFGSAGYSCWLSNSSSSNNITNFLKLKLKLKDTNVISPYHYFILPFIASLPLHFTSFPLTLPLLQRILLKASYLYKYINNYGIFDPFGYH